MSFNRLDAGATAVRGYCPMGCGETLNRIDQQVICTADECPRPTAAKEILSDTETEHVVEFTMTGFTIRHPLRERLDDGLLRCELHRYLAALDGPPQVQGRYRSGRSASGWAFERLGS